MKPAHAPPEVTHRTKQGAVPYSAYMGDACQGVLGPLGGLDVRLLRAVRTQLLAREHSASASRCVEAGAQVSRDPAGGRRAGGGELVQQHEIVDQAGLAT